MSGTEGKLEQTKEYLPGTRACWGLEHCMNALHSTPKALIFQKSLATGPHICSVTMIPGNGNRFEIS